MTANDTSIRNHTPDDVNMLDYFWTEKGDVKRYVSYDRWAANNPSDAAELDRLISDRDWAEKRISAFIETLKQKHPLPEDN